MASVFALPHTRQPWGWGGGHRGAGLVECALGGGGGVQLQMQKDYTEHTLMWRWLAAERGSAMVGWRPGVLRGVIRDPVTHLVVSRAPAAHVGCVWVPSPLHCSPRLVYACRGCAVACCCLGCCLGCCCVLLRVVVVLLTLCKLCNRKLQYRQAGRHGFSHTFLCLCIEIEPAWEACWCVWLHR